MTGSSSSAVVPCLAAFASGVVLTGAALRQDGQQQQQQHEVPYGNMRLELCSRLVDQFSDKATVVYDMPVKFVSISKQRSSSTFTQRLESFHGAPVSPLCTVVQTERLLTSAFLAQQQEYFAIPQYAHVISKMLLPMFMDAAERELARYCVLTAGAMKFTFYCPSEGDAAAEAALQDEMRSALELALTVAGMCSRQVISVHLFLCDLPKEYVPELGGPVGSARFINSGRTTSPTEVFVYRREEMVKVLCHELVHAFGVDCYSHSMPMSLALKGSVSVQGAFNPAEAVTETIARLLYSLHVSHRSDKDLGTLLQRQLHFAIRQAATILYMNGITACSELEAVTIQQDTYALEYYVFTACLLYSLAQKRCDQDILLHKLLYPATIVADSYMAMHCTTMIRNTLRPGSGLRNAIDVLLAQSLFYRSLRMSAM